MWSRALLLWLAAYVTMIAGIVAGMVGMRSQAIAVYGTAQAQAEWDAWRDDAKKMAEQPNVVRRRAPQSLEPPALVLMRDYFAICLAGALMLSSVLFGTFMILVRGAMKSRAGPASAARAGPP